MVLSNFSIQNLLTTLLPPRNFFFNPPAHLCAVTYMTEISLIVTLNNQFTIYLTEVSLNSTIAYKFEGTLVSIYDILIVSIYNILIMYTASLFLKFRDSPNAFAQCESNVVTIPVWQTCTFCFNSLDVYNVCTYH